MSSLLVSTEKGDFRIELLLEHAPETCRYFQALAQNGQLDNSNVFRIVNQQNDQSAGSSYINVVQIGPASGLDGPRDQIVHESTNLSGLQHKKWAVSAARYNPGDLYRSFFICMEDEPHLDFGGMRQPDEQGFAVFGQISQGHEVVEQLFALAEPDEILGNPIHIPTISAI